ASIGGLIYSCHMLLERSADVNTQGRYYGNALQAASCEGHKEVVKLLLERILEGLKANDGRIVYANSKQ
ncbi:hypothetical protein F5883DRAFT_432988, partial [Diaporthe sp. PMI_573]